MNLEIATVLSCTDGGCRVQSIHDNSQLETNLSKPMIKYNISVQPNQFVIIDRDTTPPETIFRWSRATVTKADSDAIEVSVNGQIQSATRATVLQGNPQLGDEVLLKGYATVGWRIIDFVRDGKPTQAEAIAAEWFPLMKDAVERAQE